MFINSNFTFNNTCKKLNNNPSFGKYYPYEDIMSIMSGAYAHNIHSSSKSVAALLKTDVGDFGKRSEDYSRAKAFLIQTHPELIPLAENFKKALDKINTNHFKISKEQVLDVIDNETKKYGSIFIDI